MADPTASIRYRFSHFELQPEERRLLASGDPVHLGPHAFDLLVALVERTGHLVTKDELLQRVWRKVIVEENTLQAHISALRKILGADAIVTVTGRGYRFALPVRPGDRSDRKLEAVPRHNLPNRLTSFIGREQEIARCKQLIGSTRLLTLTGAGGAGKTRLAIQVAQAVLDAFPDGAWLVELASISDPALVPQAVADALGQKERPAEALIDTIAEYLAASNLLLVLDNAEHLLDACARLLERILQRSPGVVAMVTSRERVGLAGELTYRVPSLTVPDANLEASPEMLLRYESVRLLVERTRLVRPAFVLTAENAPAVASICYRLDGIPLAIELASARLRSMSAEEVSRRLDQRFALLTDGSRTALPRHRTLRSLIDWSYDLLSDTERALLLRVSVFAGGWTLESAEKVCTGDGIEAAAVVDLLASLADKNLVTTDEHEGTTRYKLLETVRQYANERLRESGEEAHWRSRHFAYFVALAEEAFPKVLGHEQTTWLDRLAREHDNVRAALTWSLSQADPEAGLLLANSFFRFWLIRGHWREPQRWYSRLLDAGTGRPGTRNRARGLHNAGTVAVRQGDYIAGESLTRQSLALCRELDEKTGIAFALSALGYQALVQAKYDEAEQLVLECVALNRARGDDYLLAVNVANLGEVAHVRGDYPSALALFEEALALVRNTGHRHFMGELLPAMGSALCKQGNLDAAEARLVEAVRICKETGAQLAMATAMEAFAEVSMARNAPSRAARIWGAAERLRHEIAAPMTLDEQSQCKADVAAARVALGDDAFEVAWHEGRTMTLESALAYAVDGRSAVSSAIVQRAAPSR